MLTRLKKRFLDLPISQKFVSIFAVMTLLSCAVMVGALHLGLSVFEEKLYEKSLQELDFFVQSIDDDLQQMDVLTRSIAVDMGIRSVLSVRVPTLTTKEEESQNTLSYGLAETSAQLDGAIESLSDLLPKLIKLAEVEKTCDLLADEIEKTRRRVNALEYVMIPQFQETIRFITMKLDENERGNLTRLMKVKDMIQEREVVG